MECSFQIKVFISDQFFMFPYKRVEPQNDIGNKLIENLIVYVPTEEDRLYIDKKQLPQFKSVLIYRHEHDANIDSRSPKKTSNATIVYWNPLLPITEIGAGETKVFSVLLTNNLFYCNTMIIHHENPKCPVEFTHIDSEMQSICGKVSKNFRPLSIKNELQPIACEIALSHFKDLIEKNNFLLCFNLETSMMVKILSLKRIFCIFQYRKQPARYVINLPHAEIDILYNKLNWERTRRLIKGDIPSNCVMINRASLNYIKHAQILLNVPDYSQTVVNFVKNFQSLIFTYQLVPDVLIKLNNLEKKTRTENFKNIRVFCKNDSVAVNNEGLVPINMPNIATGVFDNSDFSNATHIRQITRTVSSNGINNNSNIIILPVKFNYFL